MRRAIRISEAFRAGIIILAVLAILSVFPARIWQRTITERGGGVRMEVSDQIDDAHSLVQVFVAQYDRLGSIDVYVNELLAGRCMWITVFDENMQPCFRKFVDLGDETIPGYVNIPLGVELEVGKAYRLLFFSAHAAYTIGLQNIPDGASPYFAMMFMHEDLWPDWHADMVLHYAQPMDKKTSFLLIAVIAVLAILLERLTALIAARGKGEERLVTVGGALRAVLIPLGALVLLIMLFLVVTKHFDRRLTDIVFYCIGFLFTGGLAALWLIPGESGSGRRQLTITNVIEMIQCVFLALAIQATCEYLNALTDAGHTVASRKEVICLAVFFLLFLIGPREQQNGAKKRVTLNVFGMAVILFFVLLVIFRNGWLWGITLSGIMAAALLSYFFSPRKERWLPVLSSGLLLHFIVSVGYCLLHRYFVAFVNARFAFVFHTVTQTAEYLAVMCAVSFALLLAAIRRVPRDAGLVVLLRGIRTEAVLFGSVCAYVLFTVSRTGILAVCITVFLLLIVAGGRYCGRGFVIAALSAILCFPAVFTLQRVVPVMVGRPVFMTIEDAVPETRGALNWDNTFLISLERYTSVFLDKMLSIDPPEYNYPEDWYNYDDNGEYLYPEILADAGRGGANPAAAEPAQEEDTEDAWAEDESGEDDVFDESEEPAGIERMANGRLAIWRAYLADWNLTGHPEMEVVMPDGEHMVHAHNAYLQVMHDHGMITGVIFVLLIFFAMVAGTVYGRMNRAEVTSYVPLALTVGFAAAGLTEWTFHLGNMMTIAMLLSWAPLCFRNAGGNRRVSG